MDLNYQKTRGNPSDINNGCSIARADSQNTIQSYNVSNYMIDRFKLQNNQKHDPSILASPMASRRDFGALLRQQQSNSQTNPGALQQGD